MCLVADRPEEHGLGVVTGTLACPFEPHREPTFGNARGRQLSGRYVTQEVPHEPTGPVYGRPGAGQTAQDVLVDVGGGVADVQPTGGEAGEFVAHSAGDVAQSGGEERQSADEGTSLFEPRRLLH
ncbi:hypothetical protein ACFWGM_36180, partial [Streptomyces roseolus]|uniref:hypothetical protein n=1 Tax=Streptomyces roseolus TaxID=67358 RepID=UPI00365340A6